MASSRNVAVVRGSVSASPTVAMVRTLLSIRRLRAYPDGSVLSLGA